MRGIHARFGHSAAPRDRGARHGLAHPALRNLTGARDGSVRRAGRQPDRLRELEAGCAAQHVVGAGRRRSRAPGLRHPDQRQPRPDHRLQGHRGLRLALRRPPSRLVPGQRRAPDRVGTHSQRAPAPGPAAVPDRHRHGPRRLRQLGSLGQLAGPGRRGLRRLPRAAQPGRHRRPESHRFRRPRRLEPLQDGRPDLGHDVGGVQHLRRLQPLPGSERAAPRVQGQLQPPLHHRLQRPPQLVDERRAAHVAVPRAQRLRRLVHLRGRHRPQRRALDEPPDLRVVGSRRVLVGPAARQRRGRAATRV